MRWVNLEDHTTVDAEVVQGLIQMFDETNELVKKFRQQRDRFESDKIFDLEITLKVSRAESGRENHVGPSDEVAGIIVGDTDDTCGYRDIVIHDKIQGLMCASYVHPKLMALQYPILFPNGEDGFHPKIKFQKGVEKTTRKRVYLSMKDYYCYSFQVREKEGMTRRLEGRLFQQYLVDVFSSIEQTRLWWLRTHQTNLRNELYRHIYDSVKKEDSDTSNVGTGHPDIFLTMTYNSLWDETLKMMEYLPRCEPPNCLDIISRVFKLKFEQLMGDIKKNAYFGVCVGVMYVVEFQKRGLLHVHMYCEKITFDDSGFPIYRRRRQDISVHVRKEELDNCWVVPYNRDLLVKYQCHMNVELNSEDLNARKYTYDEIPQHYVWNDSSRQWNVRKRGSQIGRMCYAHYSAGESWILHLLLTKVRGPTSFKSLRTVSGVSFTTFREPCKEYGLLDDDKEWNEVLQQCSDGGLPPQIRQLFVHIIVNYKVTDIRNLWASNWHHMVDDILLKKHQIAKDKHLFLNDRQLKFYILSGKSLKNYDQLPQPPDSYLNFGKNNLVIEETGYDTAQMETQYKILLQTCNDDQIEVFNTVLQSVYCGNGGIFFIGHNSDITQLIKETKLIIWDEAPIQHRYAFECLDRTLKDIMKYVDPSRFELPFGGITVVFGGDFRKIFPVIPGGDRADVVAACIPRSRLWDICTFFELQKHEIE
ncbi:uncharacterized protein LOC141690862 [Apium graveolens]|uniref:uncharacterized protein LOC141690862 n=1 Tax=Apium graveolens TaxID=4045 RepID=UPI003D7A1039